jgi:hypothetical protein
MGSEWRIRSRRFLISNKGDCQVGKSDVTSTSNEDDNDDITILGTVRVKLSGSVSTDTWSDYEQKWTSSERVMFDITDCCHFGWCLGVHVSTLAEALIEGQTSNGPAALRGLAASLASMADEIVERIEQAERIEEATDGR